MLCCVVCSTSRIPVQAPTQWQVDTAVLRLHSRRCTCLEFHPTRDNIVLSGDKKGQVAIWDHAKVYDRTVYNLNKALTNNLRFLPGSDGMQCCSASSDGTLKVDCTLCALVACQSLAVEQQIAGCLVPHTASLCTWSLFQSGAQTKQIIMSHRSNTLSVPLYTLCMYRSVHQPGSHLKIRTHERVFFRKSSLLWL